MGNISVRLSEQEEKELNEKVRKSNLSRSDYVRRAILGDTVIVVDRSKEIYQNLNRMNEIILQIEEAHTSIDLGPIRREVFGICHMLNS